MSLNKIHAVVLETDLVSSEGSCLIGREWKKKSLNKEYACNENTGAYTTLTCRDKLKYPIQLSY